MKRKKIYLLVLSLFILTFSSSEAKNRRDKIIIRSENPAKKWQDAMVTGNGNTGAMVFGQPNDETVVINNSRCWIPGVDEIVSAPKVDAAMRRAQSLALKGKFAGGMMAISDAIDNWNIQNYPKESLYSSYWGISGGHAEHVHPAFEMKWIASKNNDYTDYSRYVNLEDAEVNVDWNTTTGHFHRSLFASRPDSILVWKMTASKGAKLNGELFIKSDAENHPTEIKSVINKAEGRNLYYAVTYSRLLGRHVPEGYNAMIRCYNTGGKITVLNNKIKLEDVKELIVILKFKFLMDASKTVLPQAEKSISSYLDNIEPKYNTLLLRQAKVHGEMFNRVKLDLGVRGNKSVEKMLFEAKSNGGMTAELMQSIFAMGRYSLICSSGDFPPALMGIWGGDWNAAWTGHYTFDSNLQLAVSAMNTGNLPEVTKSYVNLLKQMYPAWRENARNIYGARGYAVGMGSTWRTESGLNHSSTWLGTGLASWLAAYVHEHYLCTRNKDFLKNVELPLFENIVWFYEDFLKNMKNSEGKYLFFPSISPESMPDKIPGTDLRTYITPNSTSNIMQCRFALSTLISDCKVLGVKKDSIKIWNDMLSSLPDYQINSDGAMEEWSYPDVIGNYANKHCSYQFGLYPSVDINKYNNPVLFDAMYNAMYHRLHVTLVNYSGHGLLHDCFSACRLGYKDLCCERLNYFINHDFFYSSLMTSHFGNHGVYNLDTELALPAVFMEMIATSDANSIQLLPCIDAAKIPNGSISGMLTKAGVKIDNMTWDLPHKHLELTLFPLEGCRIELQLPEGFSTIKTNTTDVKIYKSKRGDNFYTVEMLGNNECCFDIF